MKNFIKLGYIKKSGNLYYFRNTWGRGINFNGHQQQYYQQLTRPLLIDAEKRTQRISPDGYCGFNAVSTAIYSNDDGHNFCCKGRRDKVITDMMNELNNNKQHYIELKFDIPYLNKMLEGAEQNQELLSSLDWFNDTQSMDH